jgi:hypothetical protein
MRLNKLKRPPQQGMAALNFDYGKLTLKPIEQACLYLGNSFGEIRPDYTAVD